LICALVARWLLWGRAKAIIEEHGAFSGVSLRSKNNKLAELWQLFVKVATALGNDCVMNEIEDVFDCADLDFTHKAELPQQEGAVIKLSAALSNLAIISDFLFCRDWRWCLAQLRKRGVQLSIRPSSSSPSSSL
jgi:hypothetical protein